MSVTPTLEARALLKKYGLFAKKSWGQNFLIDERVYEHIVRAATVDPEVGVIEIGAGLGTLTARLATRAPRVIAIERDRDLAVVLRAELGADPRIEIAEDNALTYDYAQAAARAGGKIAAVGNLPYQIASPILFRLLDARRALTRIIVMLQREMVDRILSKPDTEGYGALTAMVGFYGKPRLVCRAGKGSFVPQPRVDSAVVEVVPHDPAQDVYADVAEAVFSKLVHASFNQRRKTLKNALAKIGEPDTVTAALARAGIDGQRRGETLSIDEFATLARTWVEVTGARAS